MNEDVLRAIHRLAFDASTLPENHDLWTYTIKGFDGSPYLTRTLLPRVGDLRPLIHQIHREDSDQWMHNHPWKTAKFLILRGGYVEERLVTNEDTPYVRETVLKLGDINELNADTYHRVTSVMPDTWTLGIVGDRVQDWGFLVEGVHVPHAEYFARRGAPHRKVGQ